jgi:hypothetical protein
VSDLEFKKACLKYTLIAAEESGHGLRDIFLQQALRLEQELESLKPKKAVKPKKRRRKRR